MFSTLVQKIPFLLDTNTSIKNKGENKPLLSKFFEYKAIIAQRWSTNHKSSQLKLFNKQNFRAWSKVAQTGYDGVSFNFGICAFTYEPRHGDWTGADYDAGSALRFE